MSALVIVLLLVSFVAGVLAIDEILLSFNRSSRRRRVLLLVLSFIAIASLVFVILAIVQKAVTHT